MTTDDRKKLRALAKLLLETSAAIDRVYLDANYPQLREASTSAFRASQECTDAVLEDEQSKGKVA